MIGIYSIISPSGKIYIGQSTNIKKRFSYYNRQPSKLKTQRKLYNSIQKYGIDNHKFEIIELCNIDELNVRERFWQDEYDVLSDKGLNCILQKHNGCSGILSEKTKSKISKSMMGKTSGNKGKKSPILHPSRKIIINVETGEIFNSISEASFKNNIKRTTLNAMLSGQNKNKTNLRYK